MKVLASRRSFLLRLDICLVFCCCLIFLGSRECAGRTITQDDSDAGIKTVHDNVAQSSLTEPGIIHQESKNVDEVDVINEKRLRRVTESFDKSNKEHEDVIEKDVKINRDVENDKDIKTDEVERHLEQKGELKGFKRLSNPHKRKFKRDVENVNEEKLQISESVSKSEDDKPEINEQSKSVDVEGIRRLDVDVEEEDKKENHDLIKEKVATANSEDIEKSIDTKIGQDQSQVIEQEPKITDINTSDQLSKNVEVGESPIADSTRQLPSRFQTLRIQALELQEKIRNRTFLQSLKTQISEVLPGIPKLTENQFLEALKTIISKNNIQQSSEIDTLTLKDSGLSETQIEIIKCAQQLVAPKERQSFVDGMTECIRGLNVINCMRIFIYPIIIENMPEGLRQNLPNFPIEINVADIFQGNKPKSARQVSAFNFYINPQDPDSIIFDILMEGLFRNPPNENLKSYIDEKNETFSKLLTCNKLQLLQISEKFLPENLRQRYSDDMLSCVRRFEYFSCIKYFAWPSVKKYYPALPEFPLSDSFLISLTYPNYPLIPYPGFESGFSHLPEVIDSGSPKMTAEMLINNILKKALHDYSRIPSLPTPIQLDFVIRKHWITPDQIESIHMSEQLIPLHLRTPFVFRTVECIMQFDYYNCFKYGTWPVIRYFNRQLPAFPNFQDIINNAQWPDIPSISQLFQTFVSTFGLDQFAFPTFPQFQFPPLGNFSIPDFSNVFPPFGQQTTTTTTTARPPTSNPPADNAQTDPASSNKKNNTQLESKIYKILKDVRDSMGATPLSPSTYTNRKVFLFPLMTEEQSKIFALAEALVPPITREPLITDIYFCLNNKNEFTSCAKTVIWPYIRTYVKGLPEFPLYDQNILTEERIGIPLSPLTESADNFFIMKELEKIFFEGNENGINYLINSMQLMPKDTFDRQIILEILRNIKFNKPEILNIQQISYPQTPWYSPFLTKSQENIVHGVENIIPDEIRQKFSGDMIECVKKDKFTTCSRNVIFPYIYNYFQKALFAPSSITPVRQNFDKINILEPGLNYPTAIPIETKINTERQGENILITTDRKFMPVYPSNPEIVIINMLRKVRICEKSVPDFPKESLAFSPEYKQAFSNRQTYILLIAESLIPEESRTEYLQEMYKCNQKDTFLNCSRDILFPTVTKTYPDFPKFPDFENDLSQLRMISIINNLNKSPTSPRSYESKRSLPALEILSNFIPEERRDTLRILVDKLPDSYYYGLYIKMSQCLQYSDAISCGHDIIYPTLKQYYNATGFIVDYYYPITTKLSLYPTVPINASPADYEIICSPIEIACHLVLFRSKFDPNLGLGFPKSNIPSSNPDASFMPFGKLSDGSRIFKQIQDEWDSDITPSVGADSAIIPEYAGQPSANHLNFLKLSTHPFQSHQEIVSQKSHLSNRKKRNVDDLLDSYSDAIPNDKKTSVPRRIPPKMTFPNITETELLQILLRFSTFKHERIPDKESVPPIKYYVDSLNETDKALITADQYEILKLVQGLNSETAKASFMSRVIQCIRSLSFIRCVGIFVWPVIVNNLPSLPFTRDNRAEEDMKIQEVFGMTSTDFETELINRKKHIESTLKEWYKTLTEEKFEMNVGPLKVKGYGDGELGITYSGFRESRLSKFKDNKNLPSILTIISEVIEEVFDVKSNKTKSKKDNNRNTKKNRSLNDFKEPDFINFSRDPNEEEDEQRSVKDDQVINMLLEKLRPATPNVKDEDAGHYFNMDDAYRAFQVLFGPKVTGKITNQLKSINSENLKGFKENFDELELEDELKLVPLEVQEKDLAQKLQISSPKSRAMYGFENDNRSNFAENSTSLETLSEFKKMIVNYIDENVNLSKKKIQSGIRIRLPKLNEVAVVKKATSRTGRGKKKGGGGGYRNKIKDALPGIGIGASLLMQMALAHAKAAANVASILSNMALGSAMVGLFRDMMMGGSPPKVKYVTDNSHDKYDTNMPWPPSNVYAPSPHYREA